VLRVEIEGQEQTVAWAWSGRTAAGRSASAACTSTTIGASPNIAAWRRKRYFDVEESRSRRRVEG